MVLTVECQYPQGRLMWELTLLTAATVCLTRLRTAWIVRREYGLVYSVPCPVVSRKVKG